jgi:HSP20 family molecular chaperone IbpA
MNNLLQNMNVDADLKNTINFLISAGKFNPSSDIIHTDNKISMYIELPGVDEKTIITEFNGDTLTVSGFKEKPYTEC